MKKITAITTGLFTMFMGCTVFVANPEIILDFCQDKNSWSFSNGSEFPGAQGGLRLDQDSGKVMVWFDFTKGGHYVAISPQKKLPGGTSSIEVALRTDCEVAINYRVVDNDGRTFQSRAMVLEPGFNPVSFSLSGPWSNIWGGKSEAKVPVNPKSIWIMITNDKAKTGSIILESCGMTFKEKTPPAKVTGNNEIFDGCGWKFSSNWQRSVSGPILRLDAENVGGKPLKLTFDFPEMARDAVQRYQLPAQPTKQKIMYVPPLQDGGNSHNIYKIKATFKDADGNAIERIFTLTGVDASPAVLGAPVNSKDIKSLPFGVAAHFSFGKSEHGVFAGWHDYRRLIDMAAAAGFKWLRDNCRAIKDKGNYRVDPWDLQWMKFAKVNNGIEVILLIDMTSQEELPDFLARVTGIVRDTKDLVNVYELGNEPNNFGGWIQKYGGTWNGKEKDNSTSKWVLAHLKYTNAAADLIKKMRPDATVIGLGACSPTNIRYLNAGVTSNLDGIVEHPYSYCLPPEKVPYGHDPNLKQRDGITMGDANHTFAGLVNSYHEHCRRTGQNRSLWLTEFGFSTYWFNGNNEKGLYLGYSEDAQATYLIRRFIEGFTLPVAAACAYDLFDDYGSNQFHADANFGIIRHDYSPKPAYSAVQHMTALFNGYKYDPALEIKVEQQPLHRACERDLLVIWDKAPVGSGNEVKVYGFNSRGKTPMLAVWSVLPYSGETNDRACTFRVKNLKRYAESPVGIDLVTGISFDVPVKLDGDDLVFENFILKKHPVIIRLFKD